MFSSVTKALAYWRRWQEAMRSGIGLPLDPDRIDGRLPLREEIICTYTSIDICVTEALTQRERDIVDRVFNQSDQRLTQSVARVYHRALGKLGKAMRKRGIVG